MLAEAIKKRLSKEENQKGFTLIELLAVIVILGIIAVIAVPLIGNVITNSRTNSDKAMAQQIADAARLYVVGDLNGVYPADPILLSTIQGANYIDDNLVLPSTKAALTVGTTSVTFNADGTLVNVTITPHPASQSTDGVFTAAELK
ncbi:type II secretion system protein [Paenibacillus sp. sgz500958]|uniref:type II secretion system protein n=1 Tax=Paenibacillus sp. sgz500958 TaxID=3242475 RepID=UPI0036D41E2A